MGPLRSGPRGRTDGVGEYKTPGMRDSISAVAREARFSIESIIKCELSTLLKANRLKMICLI